MDPAQSPLPGPDDPTVGLPNPNAIDRGVLLRQQALTAVRRAHRLHYLDDAARTELEHYYQQPTGTYPIARSLAERGLTEIQIAVLGKDFQFLERGGHLLTETLAKVKPLAEGGMGIVYLGWDAELDRSLAIKVIKRFTDTSAQRFEREAKAMALVGNHPHCLSVHHVGLSNRTGEPFFSMPLIPGSKTLGTLITQAADESHPQGPPPVQPVIRWGYEIALALQACHEARLVHRDVKPSNVLIDDTDHALLTDFGVVSDLDTETLLTQHQSIIGTFQYMPLEQLRGDKVDHRADLYALGATLYHTLTGSLPTPSRTLTQLITQQVAGEITPPSTLRPDLPPELEQILLRCLRKDRDERYPTAADLAADLLALLPNTSAIAPIPAVAFTPTAGAPTPPPRTPWGKIATGFVAGGLAGALGTWATLRKPPTPAAKPEPKPTEASKPTDQELLDRAFGDLYRIQVLREMAMMIPMASKEIPNLEDWLRRARAVSERGPMYQSKLDATPKTAKFKVELSTFTVLGQEIAYLNGTFPAGTPPFADTIASIEARLAFAKTVRERSLTSPSAKAAWEKARRAIAASKHYNNLDLTPMEGLLPLGPDPISGLWEFWHLATGDRPLQDPEGHWRLTNDSGLVLVLVPRGTYRMGSETGRVTERPVHEEVVESFLLSKYELTQAQWQRVTGKNPSLYFWGPKAPVPSVAATNPVEMTTWTACSQVTSILRLTLPTESQWEYAARATTDTPWWTGPQPGSQRNANLGDRKYARLAGVSKSEPWDDGFSVHAPVGSFAANRFGLHDVSGNVSEWTQDRFRPQYSRPVPTHGRNYVYRGGDWSSSTFESRSAKRGSSDADASSSTLGVRPARSLKQ